MRNKDSNQKKKEKEKIVYIDDGSTIFDMSGLDSTKRFSKNRQQPTSRPVMQPARWKAIVQTYFDAVRMMLLPMLIFVGAICILFLILWFLF